MNMSKLLRLAHVARRLGQEVFAEGRAPRAYVRTRRHARGGAHAVRHPFWAGFGGAFLGLAAFALVVMAVGALFALLGLLFKVALAVVAVVLLVRFARRLQPSSTEVLIVPPEYRSRPSRS